MFKQVELTYGFDALEPHIDAATMQTHYGKHHAAYTNNLNAAVEKAPELAGKSIEELLSNLDAVPAAVRTAIRNNGGGYYNHNLYFATMSPNGGGEPTGDLASQIAKDFGSFADFKEKITAAAIGQFGSGWAWLASDKAGNLSITTSANQDSPLTEANGKLIPLLGIDVWEHAYYLKHKNLRAEYLKDYFNVVDWKTVADLYAKAKG